MIIGKLTRRLCFLIKIRLAFFKGLESNFWTVWTKMNKTETFPGQLSIHQK